MPSFEILLAFLAAAAIFAYLPGPAMLYAAAQTMARGRKAGWLAALGIHLGGYFHVAAASLGLAFLFEAVPVLYVSLKFAGAVFLIWLGARLFLAGGKITTPLPKAERRTSMRAFWESVTVEVLNPKTAIFYVAFLPQFTDPAASFPIWVQLFVLGTVVNLMFSSADIVAVVLADKISAAFKRSTVATKVVRRIGGSILMALGLNIAFHRQ